MSQATKYFSPDYFAARTRFRQAVEKAGGRLHTLALDAKGPHNEELSIDIGWFGSDQPRKVLLHSSGLHGVEAFAGSAIQLQLLDNLPKLPNDTALVLAHVLNPYGMAWLRRYNENNVDLNRNFLGPADKYTGAPEGYAKLDRLLNPPSHPAFDFFLPRAGWAILNSGMPALRQAVGGGQYEFPKGLMFGGKRHEQGPEKYEAFLAQRLSMAEQVFAIDVHTGLGKYGEDTLLSEINSYEVLRQTFGERVAPLDANRGPAYHTRGSIDWMLPRISPKAKTYFLCQEFGTYGPLRIVHALREENRWHHFGGGALDHPTKQKLKEAFYPNDDAWRMRVLERGRELFNQASALLFSETADRTAK